MATERFISPLGDREFGGPENDFVIVEWRDSGESKWEWIAPLHVHHADDEAWYVLDGVLRFRLGEEIFEAGRALRYWRQRELHTPTGMRGAARACATCS
jgi:hypothetical protein